MGYTHYWTYKPEAIEDTENLRKRFKRASRQIKKFVGFVNENKSEVYKICGGLGEGKPIINESEVWFNGDGQQKLDHETFHVHWAKECKGFCKTARKPYDLVVCFALLTFKDLIPEAFEYTSDGTLSDIEWQRAVELYEAFTGKEAKAPVPDFGY